MKRTLLRTGLAVTATGVVATLAVDTGSVGLVPAPAQALLAATAAGVRPGVDAPVPVIAYAGAKALSRAAADDERTAISRALGGNLALNAAWPVLFFRGHSPAWPWPRSSRSTRPTRW
jgi:translocator protein